MEQTDVACNNRNVMWKKVALGSLLKKLIAPVQVEPDRDYTEIGVRSHGKGIFHKEPVKGQSLGEKKVFYVKPGCLVVNIVFAWEQAVTMTNHDENGMIASHRFPMFELRGNDADLRYLLHFLLSKRGKQLLELASPGGAGRNRTLGQSAFMEMSVPLPPLKEQTAIVDCLDTWDRAIELSEKLIAAKQQQKAALMQQLLTGKVRMPGFKERWEPTKIGRFLRESRLGGSAGDSARKLTVKLHGKGVVPKVETRLGSAGTRYYKRLAGQFIYSKLDFLNGAFGLIPQELDGYESTLDLPAFDIGAEVDARWLSYFVTREAFYKPGISLANGGRKARRVNPTDFLKIEIPLPPRSEQCSIADVVSLATREIELLKQKLDALRRQKKGLMQQLLTGKVRVKDTESSGV